MAFDHDDYVLTPYNERGLFSNTPGNCEGCGKRVTYSELNEDALCQTCADEKPKECDYCEYVGPTASFETDMHGLISCPKCGGN